MTVQQLLQYFKSQAEPFTDLLKTLVLLPTPTGDPAGINRFQDEIEDLFARFRPERSRLPTKAGDILLLSLYTEQPDRIVLLAHADTVPAPPGLARPRIRQGRLHGRGSYDMKNGIALFYFVLLAFSDLSVTPPHRLELIFTPDEETGSHASRDTLRETCRGARAVILPEPSCSDGGLKVRRKGVASIKAEISGKAAHSGIEPERGKDANRGLVELIRTIDAIAGEYPGVHFNPGLVSGGKAVNVVSPASVLEGEMRCFSNTVLDEAVRAVQSIDRIGNVDVRVTARIEHPALELDEKNRRLVDKARLIARRLGSELTTCETGGSSDGADLSAAGIPVLDGAGMRGGGAHADDEYVELADFPFRASLFTRLIQEMSDD